MMWWEGGGEGSVFEGGGVAGGGALGGGKGRWGFGVL